MKLRVYLDTTVLSAAEDIRTPERQQQTVDFFGRADQFLLATSERALRALSLAMICLAVAFVLVRRVH